MQFGPALAMSSLGRDCEKEGARLQADEMPKEPRPASPECSESPCGIGEDAGPRRRPRRWTPRRSVWWEVSRARTAGCAGLQRHCQGDRSSAFRNAVAHASECDTDTPTRRSGRLPLAMNHRVDI